MPFDQDLTADLTVTPTLEVMTRILTLPTRSLRQARAITRLQLDRLSPLPPNEVVFDLAVLKAGSAEVTYALGLLRRSALQNPDFASRRSVTVIRRIEDTEVTFRFRNVFAVDDREVRWLARAPQAALIALGLGALALAGQIRAEQWRAVRLPEIAAAQRDAVRQTREARDMATAWRDWNALERTDAASRLLCVAARTGSGSVPILSLSSDATQVALTTSEAAGVDRLQAAGGKAGAAGGTPRTVFEAEVCA